MTLLFTYDLNEWIKNRKRIHKLKKTMRDIVITPFADTTHLSQTDLPVVVVARDAQHRIQDFLCHYRSIGVTRFIIVDNRSTDGTIEILKKERDIDVWIWDQEFSTKRVQAVKQTIFTKYGYDRWYICVDIDEYLVYSGMENRNVSELTKVLEKVGEKQVNAPMIDMFATRPITDIVTNTDVSLPEICDHFDCRGYSYTYEKHMLTIKGGPRARLFEGGVDPILSKTPLFFFDSNTFATNPHYNVPNRQPGLWPRAALLHFKFISDAEKMINRAVDEGNYWKGSQEYKIYQKNMELIKSGLKPDNVLVRYEGPESLLRAGLMGTPPWGAGEV